MKNTQKDDWHNEVVGSNVVAKMKEKDNFSIEECFYNPKKEEEEHILRFYKRMNNLMNILSENPTSACFHSPEASNLGSYIGQSRGLWNNHALQEGIKYAKDCLYNSMMNSGIDYFVSRNFELGLLKLIEKGEKVLTNKN